jgi:hypothetical protein
MKSLADICDGGNFLHNNSGRQLKDKIIYETNVKEELNGVS